METAVQASTALPTIISAVLSMVAVAGVSFVAVWGAIRVLFR